MLSPLESLAMFLIAMVVMGGLLVIRQSEIRCPRGYDLRTGVRPDGHFECWPSPVGDPEWDGTWQRSPDRSVQPLGVFGNQIHCTGGAHPVIVDFRTVGCQR